MRKEEKKREREKNRINEGGGDRDNESRKLNIEIRKNQVN